MSRILNDQSLVEIQTSLQNHNTIIRRDPKHIELEQALFEWVCDMRNSRKCISGEMIQAKANQLAKKVNMRLPDAEKTETQFSGGWLDNFKKRWQLKAFKLHGEEGDVKKVQSTNGLKA